ncbi:hypothetical protein L3Y21_gp120 [Gordonia phage Rabbitrun]|uniref:Uncharacterized protein n=1 Tax=Gordonia phage Rabbitrun TaxID=2762280 RepID=A0A7G8LIS7_9CAUD|nr:hypothetical protein L3Y21_gp120 [Gordonia phage Rabbitrun]QNJ57149.1 hypothetical protein SEA_RABBITRUN_116 [Gordonia phage Rabbitrun]
MSARYGSFGELAAKVDYEGGLMEAMLGYGLGSADVNQADDPELWEKFARLEMALTGLAPLIDEVSQGLHLHLEEYEREFEDD